MAANPIHAGLLVLSGVVALLANGDVRSVQAAEPNMIVMKDFNFSPMSLRVPVGARVVWMNLDSEPHTVASDAKLFRSAGLDQNETFSFTFEKLGTYRFLCSIHPQMAGTIIVE